MSTCPLRTCSNPRRTAHLHDAEVCICNYLSRSAFATCDCSCHDA